LTVGRLFRFLKWLDLKVFDYEWNRKLWEDRKEIGLLEALLIILWDPIMYLPIRIARIINRIKIKEASE